MRAVRGSGRQALARTASVAMPYDRVDELPGPVRKALPQHAREIYRKAFNSAWEQYRDAGSRRGRASREETAHRVAWAAVEAVYEKSPEGRWRRKRRRAKGERR